MKRNPDISKVQLKSSVESIQCYYKNSEGIYQTEKNWKISPGEYILVF